MATKMNQSNNDLPISTDDGVEEKYFLKTKEEVIAAIRNTSYKAGQADMLADLVGGNIDEDPLAFMIICDINSTIGFNHLWGIDPKKLDEHIDDLMKKYPNATKRALSLKPMTGDEFYQKYGIEEIWNRWQIVNERTGLELSDILKIDTNEQHQRSVIEAGNDLKSRIIWSMAGDWLDDLLDIEDYRVTIAEVAHVFGDE